MQDLYIEQLDPGEATQVRTPDGWARLETSQETIKVKGRPDLPITVRRSRHGPLISDAGTVPDLLGPRDRPAYVLAMRWTVDRLFKRPFSFPTAARIRQNRGGTQRPALMTLDDEQALWGPADATTQLQRTLALPCAEVVVKRGAQPTLVRSATGAVTSVPTQVVPAVVDTTAAGDSFAGAFLAFRLTGASAAEAAAAGNRLAARVVQHRGAILPADAMADLLG